MLKTLFRDEIMVRGLRMVNEEKLRGRNKRKEDYGVEVEVKNCRNGRVGSEEIKKWRNNEMIEVAQWEVKVVNTDMWP